MAKIYRKITTDYPHIYPEGSLYSLTAIQVLIDRANENQDVRIYSYRHWVTPRIEVITVHKATVIKANSASETGTYSLQLKSGYQFPLSNRNIPKHSGRNGFLFTNYWHAYAHMLRSKDNIAGMIFK